MTALQQLLLPLDHPRRYDGELVYGQANGDACDWLERYQEWPLKTVYITGPSKSGKSTIAHIIARRYAAQLISPNNNSVNPPAISELPLTDVILDDADQLPHEWLFHLINHQALHGLKLTLLSQTEHHAWDFETKDLASRIKSFYPICIEEMDDMLMQQLACKFLLDRSIHYDNQALEYLLTRLDRTYQSLFSMIKDLDIFLLNKHKRLTLPQAREYFSTHNGFL